MIELKRTEREINDVLNKADESVDRGLAAWPGMIYEEGVANAIRWLIGEVDVDPMED